MLSVDRQHLPQLLTQLPTNPDHHELRKCGSTRVYVWVETNSSRGEIDHGIFYDSFEVLFATLSSTRVP